MIFLNKNRNTKKGGGDAFFIKSDINYRIVEQFTTEVENYLEIITVKLLIKK